MAFEMVRSFGCIHKRQEADLLRGIKWLHVQGKGKSQSRH